MMGEGIVEGEDAALMSLLLHVTSNRGRSSRHTPWPHACSEPQIQRRLPAGRLPPKETKIYPAQPADLHKKTLVSHSKLPTYGNGAAAECAPSLSTRRTARHDAGFFPKESLLPRVGTPSWETLVNRFP